MNAVLLPLVSCFLIYVCNQQVIMKNEVNRLRHNVLAWIVILITFAISLKSLWLVF